MGTANHKDNFDAYADSYDAWYDTQKGGTLLQTEAECLRPLLQKFPKPYVELGVGSGRFAQGLGIELGLDPSVNPLRKAMSRNVDVVRARAENVPFKSNSFGAVLVAFTLCFVDDPLAMLSEVRRVLLPEGGLVLGTLPAGTAWADSYASRGREGHPIYRSARFYAIEDTVTMLKQAGFTPFKYRSTLFQKPGLEHYQQEDSLDGFDYKAGFVGIACVTSSLRINFSPVVSSPA